MTELIVFNRNRKFGPTYINQVKRMEFKKIKTVLFSALFLVFGFSSARSDRGAEETGILQERASGRSDFVIKANVNLNGAIHILSNQTDEIKVAFTKSAKASSKPESKRFIDLIDLKLNSNSSDEMILEILSPSHAPWEGSNYSVWLELYVEVPEKMNIKGKCRFMEIKIVGPFHDINLDCEFSDISLGKIFGSVEIVTTHSNLNLKSIKGNLRAETSNGEITAEDIEIKAGYAFFETTHGKINLTRIQGSVEAYTNYAPIKANEIDASDGSVVLRTNYAPLDISDISGEIICETNYSPITANNLKINHGHSKIETIYASIKARFNAMENSDIFISNGYNNVELILPSDISARLIASVEKGGKIHTKGIGIKPVLLDPTRLEGVLGGGNSRIEVKVSGVGDIDIIGQ